MTAGPPNGVPSLAHRNPVIDCELPDGATLIGTRHR